MLMEVSLYISIQECTKGKTSFMFLTFSKEFNFVPNFFDSIYVLNVS